MKNLCLSARLILGVLVLAFPAFAQSESTPPVFTLQTPHVGQALTGGTHVSVTWDLVVDKTVLTNPWAELELYLLDDRGTSMRITPELGIRTRSFDWLVPSVNMRSAHLVLWLGVQGNGELYQLPQIGTFSIASSAGAGIGLELPTHPVRAGEDLDIRWTSNLDTSYIFDVMISYDRGAHYFKAGTTAGSRYLFPVDDGFSGGITVMIVGRGADGTSVESLVTRNATVLIRDTDQ